MKKKLKHKRRHRLSKSKLKNIKSESVLTSKSDEDGVLVFQYEPYKSPSIFKKLKSIFSNTFGPKTFDEGSNNMGLKV